jgi:flavin reductase
LRKNGNAWPITVFWRGRNFADQFSAKCRAKSLDEGIFFGIFIKYLKLVKVGSLSEGRKFAGAQEWISKVSTVYELDQLIGNEALGELSKTTPVSDDVFKSLMRNVAASVTVIATNRDGKNHGMTATAICSVSADPATILVVVNRSTRTHPIIAATKCFTVNILAENQQSISQRFSSSLKDPFDGVEYLVSSNGGPIIRDVAAHIECVTISEIDVATHTVFVGSVIGGHVSKAQPLLFHDGEYKSLASCSSNRGVAAMFWDP